MDITINQFGLTPSLEAADLITLTNDSGAFVKFTNYGARVVALGVPDRHGVIDDVVLGFDSIDGYVNGCRYFGANPGPFANRIKGACFTIDGITYKQPANDGKNLLHGGASAFDTVIWNYITSENGVTFTYTSPDGEFGFPGDVKVAITYSWGNNLALSIDYIATTSKTTHLNLTHHSFFNLDGESSGSVLDHLLYVNATNYLETDDELVPTGTILPVANTPLDFRKSHPIGTHIDSDYPPIKKALGFDHCFVVNKNADTLGHCASVYSALSGRTLDVYATLPGIQVYTTNFPNGNIPGKSGKIYPLRSAICLEPQFFPNTPSIKSFPSTLLEPEAEYLQKIIYQFNKKH